MHSWRERYVKNWESFDVRILQHQRKQGVKSRDKRKRDEEPMPIEMLAPSAKRVRVEGEEEEEESPRHVMFRVGDDLGLTVSFSELRQATQDEDTGPSKPKSAARSLAEHPPEAPSQPSTQPSQARPIAPASPPHSDVDARANATETPATLQTRHDIIPSPPPERQPPTLTNSDPESPSPPRHVKRTKVRLGTPPDMFVSEPPSPRLDAARVVSTGTPSSEAQAAPVTPSVPPRAPPRFVDALRGQVLVDQEGHVPRALHLGENKDDGTEEEQDGKAQCSPVRDRTTAKQRGTSESDVELDANHPFNQLTPPPRESVQAERAKPTLDRRAVARQFVALQVEGTRREDVVRDGGSSAKRVVTAAPPSDPFSGQVPKPISKVFKFPPPHASTQSPFRLEPPSDNPPKPQSKPPSSRSKPPRHSALTRVRRQTIANGNGREHKRRRDVPSVDLVALSSTSARSNSRSSTDTSVPARPPRWSLPAFAHAAPLVFDEHSPAYGGLWREHGRRSSLVGTSPARFMLTPSPARSAPGSGSHSSGIPTPLTLSTSRTPHPPDAQFAASHGLASIFAHMSANHELGINVVEAVYDRVGSLREADEVLKGMREAAEGFGEKEIERRERRRGAGRGERNGVERRGRGRGRGKEHRSENGRAQLRYVVASEDGEGSEYSPPETSRAAMWKRQSESSYAEEEGGKEQVDAGDEEEEEEEGRAVEEELREHEDEDDEGGIHHDFSRQVPLAEGLDGEEAGQEDGARNPQGAQEETWEEQRVTEALLDDTRLAQEMEKKLGKRRYRKDIVKLFT